MPAWKNSDAPRPALAEDFAEIGVAGGRVRSVRDMAEADGDGEFRAQAQLLAGFGFGEENAAAQVLARHVEERLGGLDDGDGDECGAGCI